MIFREKIARKHIQFLEQKAALYLDIETTGLAWRTSHICLIGLLAVSASGEADFYQLFLDRPDREKELLQEFAEICRTHSGSAAPLLVHFNGDTFDLPYLRHKFEFYGLENPLTAFSSLDLFRALRPYRRVLGLSSFRQRDVEALLQIEREDTLPGSEMITLYQDYISSGKEEALRLLRLHNREDVWHLPQIEGLLGIPALFEGAFAVVKVDTLPDRVDFILIPDSDKKTNRQQFARAASLLDGKHLPDGTRLAAREAMQSDTPIAVSAPAGGSAETPAVLSLEMPCLCLSVPVFSGTLLHFFENYQEYYYLPEEDTAIHRSVALFTSSAHRQKATARTCYQKHSGIFLPQPSALFTPVFLHSYGEKPLYFLLPANWDPQDPMLHTYLRAVLAQFIRKKKER